MGKPIGLVELLWRRGFIDPTSSRNPPMKTCLEMAAKLQDFKSELPWMCHVMAKLGARCVFTPKAHCELAGRGVEYIFGCSKVYFRQENAKLDNDKRVNQLETNIRASLNKITLATVRKCSRRAREYKLAYLELDGDDAAVCHGPLKMCDIEKMKRTFKSKRSASDQDFGFVTELVKLAR